MPRELNRLLYVSLAPPDADDAVMQAILDTARRRNEALGITGALLHYGGYYLQVLEGEHRLVTALFERIRHDTRHFDARLVNCEPAGTRLFGAWSMRHVPAPQAHDRAVTQFLRGLWRGAPTQQAGLALALLQRLGGPAGAAAPSASPPSATPAHH